MCKTSLNRLPSALNRQCLATRNYSQLGNKIYATLPSTPSITEGRFDAGSHQTPSSARNHVAEFYGKRISQLHLLHAACLCSTKIVDIWIYPRFKNQGPYKKRQFEPEIVKRSRSTGIPAGQCLILPSALPKRTL